MLMISRFSTRAPKNFSRSARRSSMMEALMRANIFLGGNTTPLTVSGKLFFIYTFAVSIQKTTSHARELTSR